MSPTAPPAAVPNGRPKSNLAPEAAARLVARARDIILGRVPPPDIEIPEDISRFYAEDLKDKVPPPYPHVIRQMCERNALDRKYDGEVIAVFCRPDGFWSVVAENWQEILALYPEIDGYRRVVMTIHPSTAMDGF